MVILEVKNLTVELRGEKIIDNLSFSLKPKEILVVLGPNGAGKTVLLKTLLNLLPYKGEIVWQEGVKIGYVPQKLLQTKDLPLTVEDFFRFKKIKKEKIAEVLRSVGIAEGAALKKKMAELSSGHLQRVLIAWAISEEPNVLFFDEPTAGIDIGGEETIYNLLYELLQKKEMAIALVSHELNIVYKYATNILCLNKKKLFYGSPKEILTPENLQRIYGSEITFHRHQ